MSLLQFPNRRTHRGFTIIEIVVILIIIGLMLLIVVPHLLLQLKARKAERVKQDLDGLTAAIEHYALDNGKVSGMEPSFDDLKKYLDPKLDVSKTNGRDAFGDTYGPFMVGVRPTVPKNTALVLSSEVPPEFWSPYQ